MGVHSHERASHHTHMCSEKTAECGDMACALRLSCNPALLLMSGWRIWWFLYLLRIGFGALLAIGGGLVQVTRQHAFMRRLFVAMDILCALLFACCLMSKGLIVQHMCSNPLVAFGLWLCCAHPCQAAQWVAYALSKEWTTHLY